jgi:hypothetical protein
MTESLTCPACGAPNDPAAGTSQMACTYCGANLTIPVELQKPPTFKVGIPPAKVAPAKSLKEDAPELLRKSQPIAVKAWNTFAYWTWIRRALPACLVIVLIAICVCVVLSALPFFLNR